jgi:polyisoprenoid-binding protein YceI
VAHFDPTSATCLVLTYKEGLLSAVAHDLQIRITRFEIEVDDRTHAVHARLEAGSLRVLGAVVDGTLREGTLSDSDKQKIEQNIREDVLDARAHPDVRFVSTSVTTEGDGYMIQGDLILHGRTRMLTVPVKRRGDELVAEVRLHQPDFGIKPYSAMLGTLKIKPDVTVRCTIPASSIPV